MSAEGIKEVGAEGIVEIVVKVSGESRACGEWSPPGPRSRCTGALPGRTAPDQCPWARTYDGDDNVDTDDNDGDGDKVDEDEDDNEECTR
jgi:hypothetical protein